MMIEGIKAALDFARDRGKGKRIVLFGCMASLPLPSLERGDLICIGPKNLDELDAHFPHHRSVDDILVNQLPPALYEPGQGLGYGEYFILIAQGCFNRCSYCNIKRAKGEVRSERDLSRIGIAATDVSPCLIITYIVSRRPVRPRNNLR